MLKKIEIVLKVLGFVKYLFFLIFFIFKSLVFTINIRDTIILLYEYISNMLLSANTLLAAIGGLGCYYILYIYYIGTYTIYSYCLTYIT